jgi:phosphate starvation-inducible PhoH-like protein
MSKKHKPPPAWHHLRDAASRKRLQIKPITKNQSVYLAAMTEKKAVVCIGPAGTGKTYLACWHALEMLRAGAIARIVLTRPMQDCDESIGFIPGTADEKIVDMMVPLLEALDEFLEPGELDKMRSDGRVAMVPLGKMRGRTLKDAMVILDEAQNATFRQLRMFLTRFGAKAKMVVCGDVTQSDLPYGGRNSLDDMVARFLTGLHPAVGVVDMGRADIVRDELVSWFDEVMTKPLKKR